SRVDRSKEKGPVGDRPPSAVGRSEIDREAYRVATAAQVAGDAEARTRVETAIEHGIEELLRARVEEIVDRGEQADVAAAPRIEAIADARIDERFGPDGVVRDVPSGAQSVEVPVRIDQLLARVPRREIQGKRPPDQAGREDGRPLRETNRPWTSVFTPWLFVCERASR